MTMTKTTLLLTLLAIGALTVNASPARQRRPLKSARQTQADAADFDVEAKTPYPAAGFRPSIPFDFPNDRQPKAIPEPTTTPLAPAGDDVGIVDTPSSSTTLATNTVEQDVDIEVNINTPRTPSNSYGAPDNNTPLPSPANDVDTIEVAAEPSADFQPPTFDAIEDFAPATNSVAVVDFDPIVVDLPADDASTASQSASRQVTQPENTYGAPDLRGQLTPTDTYGVPLVGTPVDDDVVEENDVAPNVAEGEVEVLSQLRNLRNGRLVFIPADGSSLRQIYIAEVAAPIRRRQNGRLRRL